MSDSQINYSRKITMRGPLGEIALSTEYSRRSYAATEKPIEELIDGAIKAYKAMRPDAPDGGK